MSGRLNWDRARQRDMLRERGSDPVHEDSVDRHLKAAAASLRGDRRKMRPSQKARKRKGRRNDTGPYGEVNACSHCQPWEYGYRHAPECPNRPP